MSFRPSFLRWVYQCLGQPNFLRWLQWPAIARLLDLNKNVVVADLGAGPMQYSVKMTRQQVGRIIAIDWDVSRDSAALAKRNNISVLRADGQALPLADQSLDRVLISSLLHMVPEPKRLLAECHRVLKPNGMMVLSVPNQYQFIPRILASRAFGSVGRFLRLPPRFPELIVLLNERFGVGGPQGYFTLNELVTLLGSCDFQIEAHENTPGPIGSLLWESAVLGYVRFGNLAFHLLFLTYPAVRLFDYLVKPSMGSEHIVKASPVHEH